MRNVLTTLQISTHFINWRLHLHPAEAVLFFVSTIVHHLLIVERLRPRRLQNYQRRW